MKFIDKISSMCKLHINSPSGFHAMKVFCCSWCCSFVFLVFEPTAFISCPGLVFLTILVPGVNCTPEIACFRSEWQMNVKLYVTPFCGFIMHCWYTLVTSCCPAQAMNDLLVQEIQAQYNTSQLVIWQQSQFSIVMHAIASVVPTTSCYLIITTTCQD